MALEIKRIDEDEFGRLREEWNSLLDRSACDSVFLRWEWMHTWWEVFKQNRKLFILAVRLDRCLAGVAPFYLERACRVGPRYLKLCSEELSPDYLDIFAEKGLEADVTRKVVDYLTRNSSEWDVIDFDNLRVESNLVSDPALFKDHVQKSWVSNVSPYIKIAGTFEDYCKSRRDLASFSFEKKRRKLMDQMKVTHVMVNDDACLAKGMGDLFLLHEKRAVDAKMQSAFLSPDAKRFHHQLSRQFLGERILDLQLLYDGETPISVRYSFDYKRKVYSYQGGFDPGWKKWSAGGVLWHLCIKQAFDQGFAEFDFLKGAESYKGLWTSAAHGEMRLVVYNKNLRASCARWMSVLKYTLRRAKQAMKTFLPSKTASTPA